MTASIAHLGFNVAGLDLNFLPAHNVAIITRFAGYGFNVFRVPIKWELAFPVLPSAGGAVSADYLAKLQAYVTACTNLGVICLIDLHNYARRSVNGVQTWINAGTHGAPTVADLVETWLAIATAPGIKGNPLVRLGIMNEPGLALSVWAPIHNMVVAALRNAGVTNTVHASDTGGTAYNPQNRASFADSQAGGTILEVHLYTDATGSGIAPIPQSNVQTYADVLQLVVGRWRQLDNPMKLFFGEVGFDAGAPAQASLPRFLQGLAENPDVFDGAAFWAAGQEFGAGYPYCMNANSAGLECPTTLVARAFLPAGSPS